MNAEIDAGIRGHSKDADYVQTLATQGVTTVALDEEGRLVEHRPDGTRARL